MEYKDNQPFIANGLEVSQISFSGGRTAASIAGHGGITHINYYGSQRFSDVILYKADAISSWAQLYRPSVRIGSKLYQLPFQDTSIYPFGYASHCTLDGIKIKHGMWLINDAIIFTLDILENNASEPVEFQLINADTCTRIDKPTRSWSDFQEGATLFYTSCTDSYPPEQLEQEKQAAHGTLAQRGTLYTPQVASSTTWLAVSSGSSLQFKKTPKLFRKHYFSTPCTDSAYLALTFSHDSLDALQQRSEQLKQQMPAIVTDLCHNYQADLANPAIELGNKTVQSLLSNIKPVLDSIKVADIPGGMRAADSGYWIWGWDSMVHASAFGLTGDTDYLIELLAFYRRTAHPELGIFHEMTLDQRPFLSMAFAAQSLYAILLYQAYIFTGNKDLLHEYLPFAEWIITKSIESEVDHTGLIKGVALYPDHPEDLEQDGNDLSSFNNSIYYQALKVMSLLYSEIDNSSQADFYAEKATRTQKGFAKFFDAEKGYFVDSLSAADFSQRKHYPLYAILWLTPFASDLVTDHQAAIADFMKNSFPVAHGLSILPKWDSHFMYDGNQLGMYMPVAENFYREMMCSAQADDSKTQLFNDMTWFWDQLSIPEALACQYENHGLTLDNPGRKQAFCAKSWLATFYSCIAGITLSLDGISFRACNSGSINIKNLIVRNKHLDIRISGQGWSIKSLMLNGQTRSTTGPIPYADLDDNNLIEVVLG